VRYPPLIQTGSTSEVEVLNIDIAPTLLALAGIPIPDEMQGQDFLPVFQGGQLEEPRSSLLFEFWSETDLPGQSCWWKAVRTDEWKYVHYYKEPFYDELYNLKEDPYEMTNLIQDNGHAWIVKRMETELNRLMAKYDDKGGDYGFWPQL
jgi:N-acetylglucosamine-6-sulfatase